MNKLLEGPIANLSARCSAGEYAEQANQESMCNFPRSPRQPDAEEPRCRLRTELLKEPYKDRSHFLLALLTLRTIVILRYIKSPARILYFLQVS